MTNRTLFRRLALAPRLVRVTVHFEPSLPLVADKVDILEHIKGMQVRKIFCAGDLTVDQIGRFLKHLKGYEGIIESEQPEVTNGLLIKATGRNFTPLELRRFGPEVVRFLHASELIDEEFYLTSDGDRLRRYYEANPRKFLDYLAKLALTRAGWVAIVVQIDQLQREVTLSARMKLFIELISDALLENKLIKKAESQRIVGLINCLVSLRLLKQWDPNANGFAIDKERLLDILLRKSFS